MRARVVLTIAMWALMVVGAVRLFGDVAMPTGVGAGVLLALSLLLAGQSRRRRVRSWRRKGEPAFPTGPRRVLLLETGLARPE